MAADRFPGSMRRWRDWIRAADRATSPSTSMRASAASVFAVALAAVGGAAPLPARADLPDTIARIKPSIVAVGRFRPTGNPRFTLGGTGFVAGSGNLVVTNAHVVAAVPAGPSETEPSALAVQIRVGPSEWQVRTATLVAGDPEHDLALLRIDGTPMPTLPVGDSDGVREGQSIAFIGFPIGGVLGYSPVAHRGIVSSITPIALPSPTARVLDEHTLQRLRDGPFDVFQLDATAYPGNSGGPLFDAETGAVIGVLNMVFIKSTKEAALSQPSGISYAIPSKYIVRLLQRQAPK